MTKTKNPITIRKSAERGHADHGWLDSFFTFSFADYYDPAHMGFRTLRVINEDRVAPGKGFGMHPHHDMEIISYVIEGELKHRDSMGNSSIIKAGNVQRMTAGTGVTHSEFNPSSKQTVHLLQIWMIPDKKGLSPSYEELELKNIERKSPLTLIAASGKKKGVISIHQDVYLYHGLFKSGEKFDYELKPQRGAWLQMIKGAVDVNTVLLRQGDGASFENENRIGIKAQEASEFLLFDLV